MGEQQLEELRGLRKGREVASALERREVLSRGVELVEVLPRGRCRGQPVRGSLEEEEGESDR